MAKEKKTPGTVVVTPAVVPTLPTPIASDELPAVETKGLTPKERGIYLAKWVAMDLDEEELELAIVNVKAAKAVLCREFYEKNGAGEFTIPYKGEKQKFTFSRNKDTFGLKRINTEEQEIELPTEEELAKLSEA